MISNIINPYGVTIKDVVIKKFNGSEPMSIKPQVVEFVLYQSVFSPILKANLAIYDAVNLLNNYPLVGEETIEVTIEQKGTTFIEEKMYVTLKFIIAGIVNLEFGSTGRDQTYFIELHSVEAFENAKRKISKAYKTLPIQNYIEDIVRNYLLSQKQVQIFQMDEQTDERVLVVPNIRPFSAITWLTKMIVNATPTEHHNYVFYETIKGASSRFTLKPFQKLTWRDSVDETAMRRSENHPFFYISNFEIVRNSPAVLERLARENFVEERLLLNVKINKRYSVLEKIIGGYFKNEYFEIDMNQKMHKSTQTSVLDQWKSLYYQKYLQTNTYIQSVMNESSEPETPPRVKYVINNFDVSNDPHFNSVWGTKEISKIATSQIDLSIDIHSNMQVVPGDLIYLNIPEMHGFENVRNDRYLTGHFYVTENKMIIRSTGETTMTLRVNKDSYFAPINPTNQLGLE